MKESVDDRNLLKTCLKIDEKQHPPIYRVNMDILSKTN